MSGTITKRPNMPSGIVGHHAPGQIIQTVYLSSDSEYTQSGVGTTDCSNYAISITPHDSKNKILVQACLFLRVTNSITPGDHECQGSAWIRDTTNGSDVSRIGEILEYNQSFLTIQTTNNFTMGQYVSVPTLSAGAITYSVRLKGVDGNNQIAAQTTATKGGYRAILQEIVV